MEEYYTRCQSDSYCYSKIAPDAESKVSSKTRDGKVDLNTQKTGVKVNKLLRTKKVVHA